ncbi:TPA: hypothetical protein OOF39_004549 [Kluyvera ascorbata]|nr:hypothetical protein [Salmonella enterica]HCR3985051.1 hypothetical protein [Kluyvera ascorbata]
MLNAMKRYLNQPGLWWTSLFMSLSMAMLFLDRNIKESFYYFLAAVAVTAMSFFFAYKNKSLREHYFSLAIFLIPAVIIAVYAAVSMPKEASQGDYREIELGVEYAKEGVDKRVILLSVMDAMNDGKITNWESAGLRHLIFERNGFLMRADTANSVTEARKQLQILIDKIKPETVLTMSKISDDGIYWLIDKKGTCKYRMRLNTKKNGSVTVYAVDVDLKRCGDTVENTHGEIFPVDGYMLFPMKEAATLYLFNKE